MNKPTQKILRTSVIFGFLVIVFNLLVAPQTSFALPPSSQPLYEIINVTPISYEIIEDWPTSVDITCTLHIFFYS